MFIPCPLFILVWNNSPTWTSPPCLRRVAEVQPPPVMCRQYLAHALSIATEPAQNFERAIHTQPKPSTNRQHLQQSGLGIMVAVIPHLASTRPRPRIGGRASGTPTCLTQTQSRVMRILPAVVAIVVLRTVLRRVFFASVDGDQLILLSE